jgi:hypothetical protein
MLMDSAVLCNRVGEDELHGGVARRALPVKHDERRR